MGAGCSTSRSVAVESQHASRAPPAAQKQEQAKQQPQHDEQQDQQQQQHQQQQSQEAQQQQEQQNQPNDQQATTPESQEKQEQPEKQEEPLPAPAQQEQSSEEEKVSAPEPQEQPVKEETAPSDPKSEEQQQKEEDQQAPPPAAAEEQPAPKGKLATRDYSGDAHEASVIEEAAMRFLQASPEWGAKPQQTEEPVCVVITGGDWLASYADPETGQVLEYSIRCQAAFWHDKFTGWDQNQVVVHILDFHTSRVQPGGEEPAEKLPPFVKVVDRADPFEIDPSSLPADVIEGLKLRGKLN